MKDENAKVCFLCGDSFSTFRRKHHCRTCGQIYDAKCMLLISGKTFGQSGSIRVCKTCEVIVQGDDASSEYSDDDHAIPPSPQIKQIRFSDIPEENLKSSSNENLDQDDSTRQKGLPVQADQPMNKSREGRRKSVSIMGVDNHPVLARPSSSRSLKSLAARSRSSSQRHRRGRNQHLRSLGVEADEGAPFQALYSSTDARDVLPVFHTDSVIDPDLAPFMSDDASSDEESASLAAALHTEMPEHPGIGFNGLLGAIKKVRPRVLTRTVSQSLPDYDNVNLPYLRAGVSRRSLGPRTISVGSLGHYHQSPRVGRSDNIFTKLPITEPAFRDRRRASVQSLHEYDGIASEHIPNDSYKEPDTDLSEESLEHINVLLQQFLTDVNVEHVKTWQKALVPILLQCASKVDPNIHRGDDIDIRHYIKFKKIEGAQPKDSQYVSGVVFTKNLALKDMPRSVKNPRILIISFPLVYARHQRHFMSLEPVIAQEREYLRNLVDRILLLQPQVLLLQHHVAGLALQFLDEAKIAVAYNVKLSVLQAISRCTQTKIFSSVEKLRLDVKQLGRCKLFQVKTFVHDGVKKTFIYVSGCSPELGCTIVLRGAHKKTLSKLKWITEFMCYMVYNMKLETSVLRDECAEFRKVQGGLPGPAITQDGLTPIEVSQNMAVEKHTAEHQQNDDTTVDPVSDNDLHKKHNRGFSDTAGAEPTKESQGDPQTVYGQSVEYLTKRSLSVSPSVRLAKPYLLMRLRDEEKRMLKLRAVSEEDNIEPTSEKSPMNDLEFQLVKPDMISPPFRDASNQVREIVKAVHADELLHATRMYNALKRRWDAYIAGTPDPWSPLSHQRIVVLFSIVSTVIGDACEGPDLLGLEFYQERNADSSFEPDVPLGEYIERLVNQAASPCAAQRCDRKMIDHHRQYVHGDGQVSIYLKKHRPKVEGLENTILMWSCCRICHEETPVLPMSGRTWKYSFAKYLEMSFWSSGLVSNDARCCHEIHKNHIRFFGFKNIVVRVQYDSINIMEVIVPDSVMTWKVERDLQLKNDQYQRIDDRMHRYMSSVKTRLKGINLAGVNPDKLEACKTEIGRFKKRAADDLSTLTAKLRQVYLGAQYFEIVVLNRAVRDLQEKVVEWDIIFAEFEKTFFLSDRDIRRLAAAQLRKLYFDRENFIATSNDILKDVELVDFNLSHDRDSANSTRRLSELGAAQENVSKESAPLVRSSIGEVTATTQTAPDLGLADLSTARHQAMPGTDLAAPVAKQEVYDRDVQGINVHAAAPSNDQKGDVGARLSPVPQLDSTLPKIVQHKAEHINSHPNEPQDISAMLDAGDSRFESRVPTQLDFPKLSRSCSKSRRDSQSATLESSSRRASIAMDYPSEEGLDAPAPHFNAEKLALSMAVEVDTSKLLERSSILVGSGSNQSKIPRAVKDYRNQSSKVSAIAKHFEQINRQFEKERVRERRQRAARFYQSRAYPLVSSKPIVEIFRDANAAVYSQNLDEATREVQEETHEVLDATETIQEDNLSHDGDDEEDLHRQKSETMLPKRFEGTTTNIGDGLADDVDLRLSQDDALITSGMEEELYVEDSAKSPLEQLEIQDLDLPKHEKTSLLKILTSFWSERSASGWTPLDYPLIPTDHIFADSDVIVREDEPASLIAFALASPDYSIKARKFREIAANTLIGALPLSLDTTRTAEDADVERILLGRTNTHMKYQFQAGTARMQCKVFYAESFDAIRRKCGVEDRFVESLSRCFKWDSKGGKTKSLFLKTLDERFIIKSLSTIETQAFLKFAPDYFDYMGKCLFHGLPSALAKMLGFFQVVIKNPATGVELNHFLQVMENVFYAGASNKMFDLKGSMRNRRVESTGEDNEVLLDENLLDFISQAPIYVRSYSNGILASSISNDTLFCAKQNVMDYSLIAGLYDDQHELRVGIIDYIRTFTWDKRLEQWVKDRGKHKATVRNPKDYRNRFRASIPRYFPLAPSCWQQFGKQRTRELAAAHNNDDDMPTNGEGDDGDDRDDGASAKDGI